MDAVAPIKSKKSWKGRYGNAAFVVLTYGKMVHMAFLYSFASSSKGNCSYIGTKAFGILIDAGIGVRDLGIHLKKIDVAPNAIQAIFVTHEHADHVKGLSAIQRALGVPIYGSRGTLTALLEKKVISPLAKLQVIAAQSITLDSDMKVCGFRTPHDSVESQCYQVECAKGQRVCICTDLGYVTTQIQDIMSQSDVVLLESNYDTALLQHGSYPAFLKKRIAGSRGHLSNEACAQVIAKLYQAGVKRFVLGHLSQENNRPEIARQHVIAEMENLHAKPGQDYELMVAPPRNHGTIIEL